MPFCGCEWGLHLLPISVFILMPSTFIISYVIAVSLHHVEADFPYISDTGTHSPESCVFGQLLNISALLVAATMYVRCKQVEEHCSHNERLLKVNKVSLVIGMLSALGISIVGNFQETNVLIVHLIGAIMAFGLGILFAGIHTFLSYKMHPHVNTITICHLRAFLTGAATIAFFAMITFGVLAVLKQEKKSKTYGPLAFILDGISKKYFHGQNPRKWYPKDGGFTFHVISTGSEWAMSGFFMIFFLTLVGDFKKLNLTGPQIHILLPRRLQEDTTDQDDILA